MNTNNLNIILNNKIDHQSILNIDYLVIIFKKELDYLINMDISDNDKNIKVIDLLCSLKDYLTSDEYIEINKNENILNQRICHLEEELIKVKEESLVDSLTKLHNRRAFDIEIKKVEQRYLDTKEEYIIVFIDIDKFKKFNDNYGHYNGDIVLSEFAKTLKKNTRSGDMIFRYGGEEFIIISLVSSIEPYLKRLKQSISDNELLINGENIKITFSAGVAKRTESNNYIDCLQTADELLYKAKRNGRDLIILDDDTKI